MTARVTHVASVLLVGAACGQAQLASHTTPEPQPSPRSAAYAQVQQRLARGWNSWDVYSVAAQVLLPQGLSVRVGMKHNSTVSGDAWLGDALIGRLSPDAEVVTPGPHSWDGSYTRADYAWKGHRWRIESAHDGADLVMLVTPLGNTSSLPPTVVFSVSFLWDHAGSVVKQGDRIDVQSGTWSTQVYPACAESGAGPGHRAGPGAVHAAGCATRADVPVAGPSFAIDLAGPAGIGTGRPRSLEQVRAAVARGRAAYEASIAGANGPILDAIQTTLGWDTIYEPERGRVISPVSRVWSVGWGGYVLFDWDTFFAATMASLGDKDLAYANALEILREETPQGFVPNYARAGNWKSTDRSEPAVGAITVLGLYRKFHDRWFLEDAYAPLMEWNRWWAAHRDMDGYLTWGSDPENEPRNLDDASVGTAAGAILESGLDNSPMYDGVAYDSRTHLLEYADVGLMSLYVADCDALAEIAGTLGKPADAAELKARGDHYRARLQTLWNPEPGIFENRNLHTGAWVTRLSPTNFYPMLARAATPAQAQSMVQRHLTNPAEFWGQYVIPSIARDDAAFKDQNYWRGRIWGPMNYLVFLGLMNYDDEAVRKEFEAKSYALFLKEWKDKGHVHENYNAIAGTGDDVTSSDRFYHWGALLGYLKVVDAQP